MAINYGIKYASQVAQIFSKDSFIKSLFSAKMDFVGAKTVRVTRLLTTPENDYQRSGVNRYGTPQDVQDVVDEYTMTQDKSFTGIVDKGDESDRAISDAAGTWLRQQLREQSAPAADKYALGRMAELGTIMTVSAKPTKSTVTTMFADARRKFTNALVPDAGRFALVPAEIYNVIALCDEFIKLEKLGEKSVARGEVGSLFGFRIIEVPDQYFPANVYAVFSVPQAGLMPYKLSDTKVHKDPPGISGALIEGRHYYDFFVRAEKAEAMLVAVLASEQQAAVALAKSGATVTAASSGADRIYYTTDGSDPRFSMKREVYTGALTVPSGTVVKAVAYKSGKFHSDIGEFTYTA